MHLCNDHLNQCNRTLRVIKAKQRTGKHQEMNNTDQHKVDHQYKLVKASEAKSCKICMLFFSEKRHARNYCLTCKENLNREIYVCNDHIGYCIGYFDPSLVSSIPKPVFGKQGRDKKVDNSCKNLAIVDTQEILHATIQQDQSHDTKDQQHPNNELCSKDCSF